MRPRAGIPEDRDLSFEARSEREGKGFPSNAPVGAQVDPTSTDPRVDVPLESILCTDALSRRPPRLPDHEAESRALGCMAQVLADSPRTLLQSLAQEIQTTLQCDSAGISLLSNDGTKVQWAAVAGSWKPHIGRRSPRDFGPCGDVIDRNAPLLFRRFERRYAHLQSIAPCSEECLSVPIQVAGESVGTVWAIMHTDRRGFDNEDLRLLLSLSRFAASARWAVASLHAVPDPGDAPYRTLFDLAPVAVYSCDAAGVIRDYNNRAASQE